MCGIFAWAGKTPKQFDKAKFDIQGFYNITRGKHSCGVSVDGDIFLGVDSTKLYSDFLVKSNYIAPKEIPIVLGHTRHATGGAHNMDNAHPFGFGQVNDHYHFVGVHNGSLVNHRTLADLYKVEIGAKKETKNLIEHRSKIDSEVLLEAIYKTNSFDVLSKYDGAAALVFSNLKEPNVTFCYHGKSRKHENVGEPEEERPLFYYQEKRNSVYISSLKEGLLAIGAAEEEIIAFDHNIVYKITDGNVSTAVKFKINRQDQCQSTRYARPAATNHNATAHTSHHTSNAYRRNALPVSRHAIDDYEDYEDDDVIQLPLNFNKLSEVNIFNDEPVGGQNAQGNKIYMSKLRYWRNGHTIKGIYTWIPKYGFYYLADDNKSASTRFYDLVNKYFWKEDFVRSITDVPKDKRSEMSIPFLSTKEREIVFPQLYYFFDGIRIKTLVDYRACTSGIPKFNWEALSMCSAHPVVNVNYKKRPDDKQGIIMDGAPYTDTISPLGSNKIYTIKNGNCVNIRLQKDIDVESIKKIDEAVKEIMTLEKATLKKEVLNNNKELLDKLIEEGKHVPESEDMLEKDLDNMFKDSLYKFPSFSKTLKEYSSTRAKQAQKIIDVFVDDATRLLRVDITD
tara:strand:+ start:912 stop:2774 length:1863 start_codon:yes stop_codon:yes gene_type:complete